MKLSLPAWTALLTAGLLANAPAQDEPAEKKIASAEAESHAVQTEGAAVGKWTMDYATATKLASEKKLPMLLNFTGSDWCGWCKLMDQQVFAQDEWKKFAAENVVLVTLDFPNDKSIVPEKYVERNNELQQKFGVQGFPTYIILESDGETVLGQLGAGREKTPESFIEEFKGVVQMSESSIAAYMKANPDKADAYKDAIADYQKAKKTLTDWIATGLVRNEENNKIYADHLESIQKAEEALKAFK